VAATKQQAKSLAAGAGKREYLLEAHGTVPQAKASIAGASMNIGSPVLTVSPYTILAGDVGKVVMGYTITAEDEGRVIPGYAFTADDIGKTVGVKGPGVGNDLANFSVDAANDGVLVGTILSVSNGLATLSVAATQAASGLCPWIVGHTIDAALTAAVAKCRVDYALDEVPGVVVIPAGTFVAVVPQNLSSGCSVSGVRRDATTVFVVKVVPAGQLNATYAPWIKRATAAGRYDNLSVSDITLIGTFYAAVDIYGADMKMIHISTTSNSHVLRVRNVDNPSTAIGYDNSTNCEIAHNVIESPGRLARPSGASGGAGGSGIGIALATSDVSMHVHHNIIRGKVKSDGTGTGRSGINIEASSGTPIPPVFGGRGILIEHNIVENFYNGIIDGASTGAIITNNIVRRTCHGITSGSNGVTYGRMSRDALITSNDVSEGFAWGGNYSYGIGVNSAAGTTAQSQNVNAEGRQKVRGNNVTGIAGGYGLMALSISAAYPVASAEFSGNKVAECGLSGMRIYGNVPGLSVQGNTFISNGQDGVGGNKAPIKIENTAIWTGGQLSGNTYIDLQGVPTQDATHSINAASVMTGVLEGEKRLLLPQGTVANLPAASATYKGYRATVADASVAYTTANVGSTAAGGGANSAPVFCNGTAWVIG
jgi:hypothetical protein